MTTGRIGPDRRDGRRKRGTNCKYVGGGIRDLLEGDSGNSFFCNTDFRRYGRLVFFLYVFIEYSDVCKEGKVAALGNLQRYQYPCFSRKNLWVSLADNSALAAELPTLFKREYMDVLHSCSSLLLLHMAQSALCSFSYLQ